MTAAVSLVQFSLFLSLSGAGGLLMFFFSWALAWVWLFSLSFLLLYLPRTRSGDSTTSSHWLVFLLACLSHIITLLWMVSVYNNSPSLSFSPIAHTDTPLLLIHPFF